MQSLSLADLKFRYGKAKRRLPDGRNATIAKNVYALITRTCGKGIFSRECQPRNEQDSYLVISTFPEELMNGTGLVLLKALVVCFAAISVVDCSTEGESSARKSVLNRGLSGDPESLDIHRFTSTQAGDVLRDIGEGLIAYSPNGDLIGGVASSWDIDGAGLRYTFWLRPDARWSNGDRVTSEHFLVAFHRLFDPNTGSPSAGKLAVIKNGAAILEGRIDPTKLGVEAPNSDEIQILLETPTPYFLDLLAHPSAFPIHPSSISNQKGDQVLRAMPISNGSYAMNSRIIGSSIELSRNSQYWNDAKTGFDRVVYHILSPAVEVIRYRSGELDITSNVDPNSLATIRNQRPRELKIEPTLGVYYYGFNLTKPPFGENPLLRKALSMAIDREAIVNFVTRRGEQPAFGLVPGGVRNYVGATLNFRQLSKGEREAEARRLYAAAGFNKDRPLRFELRYNTLGGHELIAVAIQSMWREVLGVEAVLVAEEFKTFIANVQSKRSTDAYRLSWFGDYNDANTFLQLMVSDSANNLTGYVNPEFDKLINVGARTNDANKRRTILQQAEKVALEDHAIIPIYFFVSKHLVRSDIRGWSPNVMDIHLSQHLRREIDSIQ